jgi:hypothetical protein
MLNAGLFASASHYAIPHIYQNKLAYFTISEEDKNLLIIKDMIKSVFNLLLDKKIDLSFKSTFGNVEELQNKYLSDNLLIILETEKADFHIGLEKFNFLIKDIILKEKLHLDTKSSVYSQLIEITKNYVSLFSKPYYFTNIHHFYYLPASRSGLYQGLSGLSQIFAELSKNRSLLKNKQVELPNISEAISDYFITLSGIEIKEDIKEENPLFSIIKRIENNILGGTILFNQNTKKINYLPNKLDLTIDVSMTSSMVSEISSIVSFLKYIIAPLFQKKGFYLKNKETGEPIHIRTQEKAILFIEEPEAHLHPKVQMELMEIFVELVNVGVKIVFTSHSDYMFNKMNNLILEKKLAVEKASVIVFHKTEEGGVAKEVDINELGADDENFIEAAEALYNEKMDLIDKLNNENN